MGLRPWAVTSRSSPSTGAVPSGHHSQRQSAPRHTEGIQILPAGRAQGQGTKARAMPCLPCEERPTTLDPVFVPVTGTGGSVSPQPGHLKHTSQCDTHGCHLSGQQLTSRLCLPEPHASLTLLTCPDMSWASLCRKAQKGCVNTERHHHLFPLVTQTLIRSLTRTAAEWQQMTRKAVVSLRGRQRTKPEAQLVHEQWQLFGEFCRH